MIRKRLRTRITTVALVTCILILGCQNPNVSSSENDSQIGSAWTVSTLPAEASWSAIAYANGTFVALSQWDVGSGALGSAKYGSEVYATSSDGFAWTKRKMPSYAQWLDISYGKLGFGALAFGGGDLYQKAATMFSSDGINWKASTLPITGASSTYWAGMTYVGDKYVAFARSSGSYTKGRAASTSDGVTWSNYTYDNNITTLILACESATNEYILFGKSTPIYCSRYGHIPLADQVPFEPKRAAYGSESVVALNVSGSTVAVSGALSDARLKAKAWWDAEVSSPVAVEAPVIKLNWKLVPLPISATCITYGEGRFFAFGNDSVAISDNGGITWKRHLLPVKATWGAAVVGKGRVVAVGFEDSEGSKTSLAITSE